MLPTVEEVPVPVEVWPSPVMMILLLRALALLAVVFMVRWLELLRNKYEDRLVLANCIYQLGPGFALANFKFLENVVKGKKEEENPPLVKSLRDYLDKERLSNYNTWICDKVFVILPGPGEVEFTGSFKQLLEKEKEKDEDLCVSLEKVETEYVREGRTRKSWLEFIKFRDPKTGVKMYATVAINRQMSTIQHMVNEPTIKFTENNYRLQAQLYGKRLKQLLADDTACANNVETIQYTSRQRFSDVFIRRLRELRAAQQQQQQQQRMDKKRQ